MSEALRLEGVSKTYNRGRPNAVEVLRDASIVIEAGETVALVAPSGAGKSTLLHVAGLLDTADGGRVVLDGVDMTGQGDRRRTEARRRVVGFVYQFHHLLPEFTAAENVGLPQLADGVRCGGRAGAGGGVAGARGAGGAGGASPGGAVGGRAAAGGVLPGDGEPAEASCWRTSPRATSIPPPPSGCSGC